jgi:hypothetical protein
MKPNSSTVSHALQDVWDWKDSIYQEVKNMPASEALSRILDLASANSARLGFAASGGGGARRSAASPDPTQSPVS